MFISKKKFRKLEKRITDLEVMVQKQLSLDPEKSSEMIKDFIHRRKNEATHDNVPKSS